MAEAASASNAQIVVNIQGDEPLIDPAAIDAAVLGLLDDDEDVPWAPSRSGSSAPHEIHDPNVVKVVTDRAGQRDLFFALADSVCARRRARPLISNTSGCTSTAAIFCWRYPDLPVGPLERAERLEQLRALENGFKIRVVETEYESLGVDTPEDWKRVAALFEKLDGDGQ